MQKNSDCANATAIMSDSSKVRVKGPPTCAIILWKTVPKETSGRYTKTTRPCNLCFNVVDFKNARVNFHDLIEKQKATWKPSSDCMGLLQLWEENFTLLLIFLSCANTHSLAATPRIREALQLGSKSRWPRS